MLKSSLGDCNGNRGGRGFTSGTNTNATLEHYCYQRAFFLSKKKIHSISCSFTASPSPSPSPSPRSRIAPLTADDLISRTHKPEKELKRVYENEMTTMKPVIQKGDVVCLADLLFTRNRDSLVKAEQLAGKVVVIFFVPLYGFSDSLTWCTELLKEIYHDSRLNNTFEVVFVAFLGGRAPFDGNKLCHLQPPECFHDIFSSMPWTAIPFSDIASRESLQRRFGVPDTTFIPKIFVIDSTGRVVQDNWLFIDHYGASGYPYSDERINFLKGEDEAVAEQPSLKALLTSPQRDYVISNQGQKVPIHILEDKEVILYFYREGRTDDRLTEQLKTAYEKSAVEQNFEIVLIYSDPLMISNEETFRKKFKTMPWLAIPFRDPNIRKLDRIFEYPNIEKLKQFFNHCSDPHLSDPPEVVIFGHHGEFFEPFGKEILLQYGTKASPFTRKVAAKLETEKVKELTLEMLCFIYTVFRRKDGSEVPFSELAGKRVILFYEKSGENCPRDGDCQCQIVGFLKMLKEKYLQMKGTDEEFEVIHIVDKNEGGNPNLFMRRNGFKTESFASVHIRDFPWLVSLKNNQLPASFGTYIYLDGDVRFLFPLLENPCLILAFDQDARLVRRTFYPTLEDTNFPFGDIEEETSIQLNEILNLSMGVLPYMED